MYIIRNDLITGISQEAQPLPQTFILEQNYPNPFNPVTIIRFGLPRASEVKIEVYNLLGQKVAELLKKRLQAGYHEVQFDGSRLASGVYIYRMQAEGFRAVKKLLLLK